MMARYVRVHQGQLQTPVQSFSHPGSGRKVTVIGTIHFASATYYTGLQQVIDALDTGGALVHHEDSRHGDTYPDATDEEQQILHQLRRADELMKQHTSALGWTSQMTALGYPPHWQRTDLDTLQIIRQLGLPLARTIAKQQLAQVEWADTDRHGYNRMRLQIALMLRSLSTDARIIAAARRGPAASVLVTARNQTALTAVTNSDAGAGRDLVLIWGLAHLPGIHTGLTGLGFEPATPQWHTAVDRRPSIRHALLQLLLRRPAPSVPDASASVGPPR